MISFLSGESGFGPSRLPANGSGGDSHHSLFLFFLFANGRRPFF